MILSGPPEYDDLKLAYYLLDRNVAVRNADTLCLEVGDSKYVDIGKIAEKLFEMNNEEATEEMVKAFKNVRKCPNKKVEIKRGVLCFLNYANLVKRMISEASMENKSYLDEVRSVLSIEGFDHDFLLLDIRAGRIDRIDDVQDTAKMYCERVMLDRECTICSGLRGSYSKEELLGKTFLFVSNGKKVKFKGIESEGMILCGKNESSIEALAVSQEPGTRISHEGQIPVFANITPGKVDLKKRVYLDILSRFSIKGSHLVYKDKKILCGDEYVKTKMEEGVVS